MTASAITMKNLVSISTADTTDLFDVIIIGGGLVGASLAVALKSSGKRILLVESGLSGCHDQPDSDQRTIALTHGSKLVFSAMGVWEGIASQKAETIKDIHVSNRGHLGQTHLSHYHVGTDALGYVVPAGVLSQTLWQELQSISNLTLCCPGNASEIVQGPTHCTVTLALPETTRHVTARLVVFADGGRSGIIDQLSHKPQSREYPQSAILSIVNVDRPHHGRAYERFTDEGPLALLPHSTLGVQGSDQHKYAVVWTTEKANVSTRLSLDDPGFADQLQKTFGDRAGHFSCPAKRSVYPLKRVHLPEPFSGRTLIIGNAAHTVHPVAGQGFNLGLRDVAVLAEAIHHCPDQELGSQAMIKKYTESRTRDIRMVKYFTHGLVALFTHHSAGVCLARNLGLAVIENLPLAKRFLLRRSMGMATRQSRLTLGLPLASQPPGPQTP